MSDFILIEKGNKKIRKCLVCGSEKETEGRIEAGKCSLRTCGLEYSIKHEIGKIYGDIKITDIFEEKRGKHKAKTICLICGLESEVRLRNLKNNSYNNQSHENCKKIVFKKHEHEIIKFQTFKERWRTMWRRTTQKTHKSYEYYKDKKPSERWKDFMFFYNDMYNDFKVELQLDRTDNSKGYSKENCKWATPKENMLNRGSTKIAFAVELSTGNITKMGETFSVLDFAKHTQISSTSIYDKLNNKVNSKEINGYAFFNTEEECRDHLLGKYRKVPTK